ncbi:MAG: N-6 DNA methylase [Pseudomonadota bacterium]
MIVPARILDLVERFEQNLDAYKEGKYNETQVRREFIDPFFEELGWDITNKKGYAEAYKEVVHEDVVKVGGATKAPDYSFRIGGVRKFFLEAKKPSVNIREDTHPAYQLRRYAWSAKLPLSILTDFEEFAVYDCRVKPGKTDKASHSRVLYMKYIDYPERWDDIAGIFSREAILKGSFDKYIESKKAKRGTAEVDTAFLQDIEQWRDQLARNIALRNPDLTQRELNFAVQRTIDRIIFLRICEDRGIETYGRLMTLQNGNKVYKRLFQLFRQADDRYNSGLFHFRPEKEQSSDVDALTPGLNIDDRILKDILKNLYYPDSPYEFSVLPADILGQVYEQFLGKVVRLTPSHRAIVEDKPEVRKAGGVYYTPIYIVDYIVKNTVGKLVEGKKAGPRGGVSKLKILDPACGSGSFLIGAYQFLLDWHLDQYVDDDPNKWARGKSPRLYQGPHGEWRLTTDERKRILLNNMYGVDIDPQAVETTKLSLLLKVLEGEDEQTIGQQLLMFHGRVLPDLAKNIKCGNSLIGPDFYKDQQMTLLDEEETYRINAFDWQSEFPEIMKASGFDAVIGNPPYVIVENDLFSYVVVDYLRNYNVAQYKLDLFHLFIQKGVDLLSQNGLFGYIVPNPWLTLQFTNKLRHYLLQKTSILKIVIFDHLVFQSADVHTALVFVKKCSVKADHRVSVKNPREARQSLSIEKAPSNFVLQKSWSNNEGYIFETRLVGELGKLIVKLMLEWPSLRAVARASLGCQAYNRSKHTPKQIADRVFHEQYKAGDDYLPELAGSDVERYEINRKRGQWIKYGPWLHDYRTMDWLQGSRILVREIVGKPPYQIHACYAEETYCNYKTILNVNPSEATNFSMKYLLGLLNSRLLSFLYPYMSNKMVTRSFPRLSVGDLRKLPIRTIDFSDPTDKARHDQMIDLVENMLTLHKKLTEAKAPQTKTVLQRQIETTDRQIDQLVYELYGLTEEEIKIVEESAG